MSSFLFSICTNCGKYYLYHSTYQLKNCNYNLKSNLKLKKGTLDDYF